MKKLIALVSAFALVFSLSACGKSDSDTNSNTDNDTNSSTDISKTSEATTKLILPEPAANISPMVIDCGWNEYTEEPFLNETADIWYPATVGKNKSNYIYFHDGNSIYKVVDGELYVSGWVCTDDKHMMPDEDSLSFEFEIVFIDYFTLYDYITDTYYTRGSLDEYEKKVEGKKFVCKTDSGRIVEFLSDGKAKFTYNGETEDCNWEFFANRIIYLEHELYGDNFYIYYNADGSVQCMSDSYNTTDNAYLPA